MPYQRASRKRQRGEAAPDYPQEKFGIYLNTRELKIVRISCSYWIPSGEDWVLLIPEVNATLLKIRELARKKWLVQDAEKIVWGDIPPKDSPQGQGA